MNELIAEGKSQICLRPAAQLSQRIHWPITLAADGRHVIIDKLCKCTLQIAMLFVSS